MAIYKVKEGKTVNAGAGKHFDAGEDIELNDQDAAGLLENGTVELKAAPQKTAAPATAPKTYDKGR